MFVWASVELQLKQDCVVFESCIDRQRLCRQTERTCYSKVWLSQGVWTCVRTCVRTCVCVCVHKRPSSLSLYTSAAFPLTHGTQIKRLKQRWKTLLWIKPSTSSWDLCAKTLVCWAPIKTGDRTTLGLSSHTTPDLHTLGNYIARILTVFLFYLTHLLY